MAASIWSAARAMLEGATDDFVAANALGELTAAAVASQAAA
jgi:hypothetical protein